jgi:flagellar hook-length control protein FliK
MSAPPMPSVGAFDIKAVKPVAADSQEATVAFAELLSIASTEVSPGSETVSPGPIVAPTFADDEPDSESENFSPEGWLDSLLLALNGVATRTARDSAASTQKQLSAALVSNQATVAAPAVGDSDEMTSILMSERAIPPSGRELVNDSAFGAARSDAEKNAVLLANASINRVAADSALATTDETSNQQWSDHLSSSTNAGHVVRSSSVNTSLVLTQYVGTPAWQNEVATQVAWLVRGADQSATLTLNPVDLGPVDVRITVRESEATVVFAAAHADTRTALEAALPRLRDLFAGQGLALIQGEVLADASNAFDGSTRGEAERQQADLRRVMHVEGELRLDETATVVVHRSLLDLYA